MTLWPEKQIEIPLQNTIGERIKVSACTIGEEYLVDCEDGHAPYKMTLLEGCKFLDAVGAKAELTPNDFVWRLPPTTAPTTAAAPVPVAADSVYAFNRSIPGANAAGFAPPPQAPPAALAQEVWTPVGLRAGNCLGTGKMVDPKGGNKILCPVCKAVRPVDKASRGAASVTFPGHRPLEKTVETAPTPAPPPPFLPVPPIPDPLVAETAGKEAPHVDECVLSGEHKPEDCLTDHDMLHKEEPPLPGPDWSKVSTKEEFIRIVASQNADPERVISTEATTISTTEAATLSALFRDRAISMKSALSEETVALLRRLGILP